MWNGQSLKCNLGRKLEPRDEGVPSIGAFGVFFFFVFVIISVILLFLYHHHNIFVDTSPCHRCLASTVPYARYLVSFSATGASHVYCHSYSFFLSPYVLPFTPNSRRIIPYEHGAVMAQCKPIHFSIHTWLSGKLVSKSLHAYPLRPPIYMIERIRRNLREMLIG